MAEVTTQAERKVARPLHELVRLIKADLERAKAAAKTAAMPYYQAAGEKMIEARAGQNATEFEAWCQRNFGVGRRQANEYMNIARHNLGSGNSQFASIREVIHNHETRNNPNYGKPASWRGEVDDRVKQAQAAALRLRDEALTRAEEREAERKLAMQLIDIGFKALASKLHPDKGGTRDAMSRLNRVRDRLKKCA